MRTVKTLSSRGPCWRFRWESYYYSRFNVQLQLTGRVAIWGLCPVILLVLSLVPADFAFVLF